ncbi:MAG TPA: cellulase family glycosylhydrolase [Candidatus Atribacteria bacterium]|nr:cellulase family glycosylhydrolase [Candidatus Atribacteria bacterium]
MMDIHLLLLLIVFLSFLFILKPSLCYASNKDICTRGRDFIDKDGREVILHGINMVCKDKNRNYIGPWDEGDFNKLREWGINCIRLGIIWDGLEPSPGSFSEEYLEGIDKFINLASLNNMYVILDMHQDLYSHKFGGDGAPQWAILDEGKPHIHIGDLWSDAYFTSPAVKTAFDNFWNNSKAPDGLGLQDHYILSWQYVAERYKSNPIVIGYDFMNEPFIGSDIDEVWEIMKKEFLKNTNLDLSAEELDELWLTDRMEIIEKISELDAYPKIIDSIEILCRRFEVEKLMPFYKRLISSVREVDKESLVFLEPSVLSNVGVYSAIKKIDNLQVYAPHAYDILTDTPFMSLSDLGRISMIMERHNKTSERLGIPMLIGEWGAYGTSEGVRDIALFMVQLFEELRVSETYWAYSQKVREDCDYFEAIRRPYPVRVAGSLKYYQFDRKENKFWCEWEESSSIKSGTIIYLPSLSYKDIKVLPDFSFRSERIGESNSGYIIIPNDAKSKRIEILF